MNKFEIDKEKPGNEQMRRFLDIAVLGFEAESKLFIESFCAANERFVGRLELDIEIFQSYYPDEFLYLVMTQYKHLGPEKSYVKTLLRAIRTWGQTPSFRLPSTAINFIPANWVILADQFLMSDYYKKQWEKKYNGVPEFQPRLFGILERAQVFFPEPEDE
jgi:hypothetical protein